MDLINSLFKGDKAVWIILLSLLLVSVIEVFSASSTLTFNKADHWGPITQHSVYLLVGFAIVVITHNIPYKWFKYLGWITLPVSVVMLIIVMGMGTRVNGAARWFEVAGIQFQPSELAKMAVVIITAILLARGQTPNGANSKSVKSILIITGIVCLLIMPENYSTAMLLAATVYLMMVTGRVPIRKLLAMLGIVAGAGIFFLTVLLSTPNESLESIPGGHRFTTWKARIISFGRSEKVPAAKYDIYGSDAQVGHANIAIASSNIIGKGPGNSVERNFLSQAYSDFIFAIIIEELGLIGSAVIVMLYIWLLIRAGKIASQCDRSFPAFLVTGIALLLVSQAFFNMCVSVGLVPVTGQPLPLISRGGTSIMINCIYIGIILSVSRYAAEVQLRKQASANTSAPQKALGVNEEALANDVQTAPNPDFVSDDDDSEMV